MLFSRSALAAALVASANGFLVPSSLEPVASTIPSGIDNVVESQLIKLDCPGCAYFEGKGRDGKDVWSQTPNYLVLNFTAAGDKLYVNDRQLFPVVIPPPLYKAHQVPSSVDLVDYTITETISDVTGRESPFHALRLGTAVLLQDMEETHEHMHLLRVQMNIGEIEGHAVSGIDGVELKAIQVNGKMMLNNVETRPTSTRRPCAHRRPQPQIGQEHHAHKAHRHHGFVHRVMHRVVKFTMNVVVPVLVGGLAGITVGLVAVVLSQAMVMLWAAVFGRGYVRLEQEEEFAKDVKELPAYEEVIIVSPKDNVQ